MVFPEHASLPRPTAARQRAVIPTCLALGLGLVTGFTQVHGGIILSVDYLQGTVSAWDSQSFNSISTFASGLTEPLGVGADAAGFIYVTTYDTTGSILKYNKAGTVVDSITGLSFRPYAITQGPDGFLYTADASGQRIVRINTDLDSGSLSTWTTMVGQPTALQFDPSGNLFVTTAANGDDVQKFSPTGTLLQVLADDGILGGFPSGIALGTNGDIYVGRSPFSTGADVALYSSSGTLIDATFASVPNPYGLLQDGTYLFVASANGSIYRFSLADGSAQGILTPGTLATYMAFADVPESPRAPFIGITGVLSVVAYRRFRHRQTASS